MHRVDSVHLLRAGCVAGEALRVNFFSACCFKFEEFGSIRWICHVFRACSVASFAALFGGAAARVIRRRVMARFFPGIVFILVASLAGFRAGVSARGGSLHLRSWLLRFGTCCRRDDR